MKPTILKHLQESFDKKLKLIENQGIHFLWPNLHVHVEYKKQVHNCGQTHVVRSVFW